MKYLNGLLYIEWDEALEAGIKSCTLKLANHRKSRSWEFKDDPIDNRRVLIGWDKLKSEYKALIRARWGEPEQWSVLAPIRQRVQYNVEAERFYLDYGDKTLSKELATKYAKGASFLDMMRREAEDKRALKEIHRCNMEEFYARCAAVIKQDKIDALPSSYRRLAVAKDSALKRYIREGYPSLIDWRIGNKNGAKVKDEVSEAALKELISHPNQHDWVFVANQYNYWATKNGRKSITPQTVCLWAKKCKAEILMERKGNEAMSRELLPQVKGMRPTAPLLLMECDDNHLDLQFIDFEAKSHEGRYIKRYKMVAVIDSFNDLILGAAIAEPGEEITIELVMAAWVDAMYYLRSLTGEWVLPHQIIADNFGIGTLEPFYKSIAQFERTPVGSKERGYIERFFGTRFWKNCLSAGANNYTGHNLTAKNRGVNMDFLKQEIKNRPAVGEEAKKQLCTFIYRLRHAPQSKDVGLTISKQDEWLKAWNEMPAERKRIISDEQWLEIFGIRHKKTLRITNRGAEPQINNRQYSFDLAPDDLVKHIGKEVTIFYDPLDMSRVLLADGDKVRIRAKEARLTPRAAADHTGESVARMWKRLHAKEDIVEKADRAKTARKSVLEKYAVDAEALLTSGDYYPKEVRQRSEQIALTELTDSVGQEFNILSQI